MDSNVGKRVRVASYPSDHPERGALVGQEGVIVGETAPGASSVYVKLPDFPLSPSGAGWALYTHELEFIE